MKNKISSLLLQPLMAVLFGFMTVGRASRVRVPKIAQVGSFSIDSCQARVSLLDFGPKYEVEVAIGKNIEDPRMIASLWTDSSRIQTALILADGRRVAGTPVHSPSVGNAGWLNEIHSYALPLGVRGQIAEAVVQVDKTVHSFPTSSKPLMLVWQRQDGAANRSQPVRTETNPTSGAAGFCR